MQDDNTGRQKRDSEQIRTARFSHQNGCCILERHVEKLFYALLVEHHGLIAQPLLLTSATPAHKNATTSQTFADSNMVERQLTLRHGASALVMRLALAVACQ
jgi:hypothetical protein